jgi:dipeptidyl aminopeptidase/acylaminoacyl peptidase
MDGAGHSKALTSGTGLEWSPVVTRDNRLVFIGATAQRPPLPMTMPAAGGMAQQLAPDLEPANYPTQELVTPHRVSFAAQDGVTVHAQLFKPADFNGKHPAVVFVHGGPPRQMLLGWHYIEYYSNDYALNQYLVSRGFVVLAVNYRLGIGYGHDFQYPPNAGDRGAAEYQDIQAAGRYLRSLPYVEPARVGLYGGSYGGYLTAMGLAHDSQLFAAGVDIHGVHNWTADFAASSLLTRQHYEQAPDLEKALAVAWLSSPVSAVATWKSPVLFIHGDDDRNVRVSQTIDLVRRLQDTPVHQESLLLVDETHGILRYANEVRMDEAIAEFLQRYLSHTR